MHEIARRAIETDDPILDLVTAFYGQDGPLAEAGWEVRPQQVQMSSDIARAIDRREVSGEPGWVQHQAPTGTGKGLSYLVPGVLASLRAEARYAAELLKAKEKDETPPPRRQCVVSTANIALQEQIVNKDAPALAAMLGVEVRATVAKSRQNYACLRRTRGAVGADLAAKRDADFARLSAWLEGGGDGDREHLPVDVGDLWPKVSVPSDKCTGRACPYYALRGEPVCYWRLATKGIARAHVVVFNHHYLALARATPSVLLCVDEGHELESALRGSLEGRLTLGGARSLAGTLRRWLDDAEDRVLRPVERLVDAMGAAWEEQQPRDRYGNIPKWGTSPHVLEPGWYAGAQEVESLRKAWDSVCGVAVGLGCYRMDSLRMVGPKASHPMAEEAGVCATAANRLWKMYERAWALAHGLPAPDWLGKVWALYVDRERDRVVGHCVPADVEPAGIYLRHRYPVAVVTSATMPDDRSFRLTLGATDTESRDGNVGLAERVDLSSPFDLPRQGLLVVPDGPSPKEYTWREWAAEQVLDVVEGAGGGALVLASSVRQMRAYAEALRAELSDGLRSIVRVQGEEGRTSLRAWFASEHDGVLVATRSFFQGVDVQGDACRLVLVDRIPFGRPDDPVEQAVGSLLVERNGGGSDYLLRAVPNAAMLLAQSSGRLIRSRTDRGVVVLLDNRLLGGGEGWRRLRSALPPFPMSRATGDVGRFLQGKEVAGLVRSPGRQVAAVSRRRRW